MLLTALDGLLHHSFRLTVERAIGVNSQCSNEDRGCDQLVGLVPVIEDWHTKVILLKVKYCTMSISLLMMSLLGDLEDPLQNLIWFK